MEQADQDHDCQSQKQRGLSRHCCHNVSIQLISVLIDWMRACSTYNSLVPLRSVAGRIGSIDLEADGSKSPPGIAEILGAASAFSLP